jgi:enoyl-CoA hydratase/carnithine racemase
MNYFNLAKAGAVAVLTFDLNEKRNPLNEDSVSELEANLMLVRDDGDVRALVLTGAGAAFCAGADLSRLKGVTDQAERQRIFTSVPARRRQVLRRTLELLTDMRMPTVAAINGFAVGGGWFIALACDLRIAVEGA